MSVDALPRMDEWHWITPYRLSPLDCLSIGQAPSQGIVYAINEDVVVKLPFQYCIPNDLGDEFEARRDDALRSFALFAKEIDIYDHLSKNPHPNLTRRLHGVSPPCLFLERLTPLESCLKHAESKLRHRWVRQLLSAVAWLETLGYTHGDLAVRNIGIDKSGCLKLFDFGTARRRGDEGFCDSIRDDHSALATCIHYILSGVDPFAKARSWKEVRSVEKKLRDGRIEIGPGAEILEGLVRAGWTGRNTDVRFSELLETVEGAPDPAETSGSTQAMEEVTAMEATCIAWKKTAKPDSRWMSELQYRQAWKNLGHEGPTDIW